MIAAVSTVMVVVSLALMGESSGCAHAAAIAGSDQPGSSALTGELAFSASRDARSRSGDAPADKTDDERCYDRYCREEVNMTASSTRSREAKVGLEGKTGSLKLISDEGVQFDVPQYGLRHLPSLRIAITSPGGGEYGKLNRRDPEAVLRDVRDGIVSPTRAQSVYGVVLTNDRRDVDKEATVALRMRQMRNS